MYLCRLLLIQSVICCHNPINYHYYHYSLSSIPEKNDESIENVESVLYVAIETVSENLERHLDTEQCRKEQVDVLQNTSQSSRLTRTTD